MNETQSSLRENLRALPRGAWILFFGTFLNKFGTFVLPFLAIYMKRLGYTAAQAGLPIGAYGVGILGASVLGGYLADRLGRRKTIVLSMFSVALVMLCLSQVRGLLWIVLFSGLAGLTGELYRPASSALLADLVPAGQRVTAFAAYRMSLNAGFAFGPSSGYSPETLPPRSSTASSPGSPCRTACAAPGPPTRCSIPSGSFATTGASARPPVRPSLSGASSCRFSRP
jgi:MFS family permease